MAIHPQRSQLMLVWPLSASLSALAHSNLEAIAEVEAHHMTSQSSPTRVEVETEKFNINI